MKHLRALLLVVLAVTLLATACGSDRSEGAGEDTSTTAGGSAASDGTFGTMKSPCGKGDAKGATDQGVTDEAIKIGYGDDAGFPNSPGLNHEMSDAVKAFVKWCNDQGGINGRQVDATYYDAKITEVNNVMTEACAKEFYMVGEGFALDGGQEKVRQGCGLPAVPGFAVSPPFANAPLKHEPMPIPGDRTVISGGAQIKKLMPDVIKTAGVIFANYSATIDSKDKVVPAFTSIGYSFKPSCEVQYNITGEPDWKPFAQKLKDCGATFVYWVGSPAPNFENLLEAAAQLDYSPVWYVDPNHYDQGFGKWNINGYGDKVYMRQGYTPLEEASSNKAVQQYLDIVEADGGDVNQLGEQAASAFLLWAQAAQSCGSDLTRKCVETALDEVHDWTAGGMHTPADPGNNDGPTCGMLMKMTGTKFERVYPKKVNTYDCDPSYLYKVTGAPVERAKIGPDRIAKL